MPRQQREDFDQDFPDAVTAVPDECSYTSTDRRHTYQLATEAMQQRLVYYLQQ